MIDDQKLRAELEAARWTFDVRYDALLVDEGQDASSTQIELYRAICVGKATSFTIFFDDHQAIYGGQDFLSLLERHGVDTSQPKRVRHQASSLALAATAFFRHLNPYASQTGTPVEPGDIGPKWLQTCCRWMAQSKSLMHCALTRLGHIQKPDNATPKLDHEEQLAEVLELLHVKDAESLVDSILEKVVALVDGVHSYGDIVVIIPDRRYSPGQNRAKYDRLRQLICDAFARSGVPYTYLHKNDGHTCARGAPPTFSDNRRTADLRLDTVKVMTIHSSKGYHARFAIIAGFDGIDDWSSMRAQMGYVALTRASKRCVAYFISMNESVDALKAVLSQHLLPST